MIVSGTDITSKVNIIPSHVCDQTKQLSQYAMRKCLSDVYLLASIQLYRMSYYHITLIQESLMSQLLSRIQNLNLSWVYLDIHTVGWYPIDGDWWPIVCSFTSASSAGLTVLCIPCCSRSWFMRGNGKCTPLQSASLRKTSCHHASGHVGIKLIEWSKGTDLWNTKTHTYFIQWLVSYMEVRMEPGFRFISLWLDHC